MAHPQRRGGESGAPVLFLDVDGVLNVAAPHDGDSGAFSRLHGSLLERLARVVRRSRARVVLSSSWRHDRQRLALLERAWRIAQLPPLDAATPTLATTCALITPAPTTRGRSVGTHSRQRVLEIQQWLQDKASGGVRWAAVDDLDLGSAADTCDQAKFVRTDPKRGLSVDDVETLTHLLVGGDEHEEDDGPAPLSVDAQLLRLAVDLIVVVKSDTARDSTAVVIDSADFSVVARLDTTEQPLRAWLRAQEAEFSLDRIATVHLCQLDDADDESPLDILHVRFPTDLTPEALAKALAHGAFASANGDPMEPSKAVIKLLLEATERHNLAEWCNTDVTTRQLQDIGLSTDAATRLAADTLLVTRLFDVLPILKPLSPQRVSLAIELSRLFAHSHDRVARLLLAEYVARGEITSRAALEAVHLMWTGQQQQQHVALVELDEMVTML